MIGEMKVQILDVTCSNVNHTINLRHRETQQMEQDGQVVNTTAFGTEGPRFDLHQQPHVQLSSFV